MLCVCAQGVFRYCCVDLFLPAAYCREEGGKEGESKSSRLPGPPYNIIQERLFSFFYSAVCKCPDLDQKQYLHFQDRESLKCPADLFSFFIRLFLFHLHTRTHYFQHPCESFYGFHTVFFFCLACIQQEKMASHSGFRFEEVHDDDLDPSSPSPPLAALHRWDNRIPIRPEVSEESSTLE